jgi:hypothetical protein
MSVMNKTQLLVVTILVMVTSPLFVGCSSSQSGIEGHVYDSKGAVKPMVQVTAVYGNQTFLGGETAHKLSTVTNSDGSYRLVIPAEYAGQRARVYASNIAAPVADCTIPDAGYNKVNIQVK